MLPSLLRLLAVLCLGAATAAPAVAGPVLSLHASTGKIHPPETFVIDVEITGLRSDAGVTLLGAFDFTLDFDPHVATVLDWTFGPALGDPLDPLQTVVGAEDSLRDLGRMSFFAVSLLEGRGTCFFCTGPYLDDLQPDTFTLVSLVMRSPGIDPARPSGWTTEYLLPRGRVTLADELGQAIDGATTVGTPVSIPEPAVPWLLTAAALSAALARRVPRRAALAKT